METTSPTTAQQSIMHWTWELIFCFLLSDLYHAGVASLIWTASRSAGAASLCNRFCTGQRAANLAVLFVARSADLDRRREIGGLFWSTNLTPRSVHLFPPPLLCKSETSMCQQLREMGGGVDVVRCCETHSRGVLKPGNSWSQQYLKGTVGALCQVGYYLPSAAPKHL